MSDKFYDKLLDIGIDPEEYLHIARLYAKDNGYNPDYLEFSTNGKNKLNYQGVNFGHIDYNDYIIYSFLELQGKYKNETARNKRRLYLSRARAIPGNWKSNKLSPNNLSIKILWNG